MGDIRHFKTYVAGTRHKNADGSSRTRLINKLEPLEKLTLDHEENNPHDPNAVKVLRSDGRQVGYLPKDIAADVVKKNNRGFNFACFVEDVREEYDGRTTSRFVDLLIVEAAPNVSNAEAQRYIDRVVIPQLAVDDVEIRGEERIRKKKAGCLLVVVTILGVFLLAMN